jgi:hypothetical protein
MSQQEFELKHAAELLAKGSDRVWRLEDIRHAMADSGQAPTKRTLERWVSAIPWLATSSQASEQLDELGSSCNTPCVGRSRRRGAKKASSGVICENT